MALAPVGCGKDALGIGTNFQHPCLCVIERALQAFAEVQVTAQEMIEYQPEVAFGLNSRT